MKTNIKSEIVLLAALFTALIPGIFLEKVVFLFLALCIFFVVDLLRYALRHYLLPRFQTLFVLIVTATLFQVASFELQILDFKQAAILTAPVFFLTLFHGRWKVRALTVLEYTIFSLFLFLIQEAVGHAFYMSAFLGAGFGSLILQDLSKWSAGRKL